MRTPTINVVTLTLANTEYTLPLPSCARFEFHARDTGDDIRFAFVTGLVAAPTDPYFTLHGGQTYYSYPVDWKPPRVPHPVNIYFASANAGAVVEVITWS
jgi:hypothetical protein